MPWQSDHTNRALATQINDPRLRLLFAHWSHLRGEHELPARRAIDPVKIPSVLPSIFICDYEEETGRLRYRLVGEDIRSCYAAEITGSYMDQLFHSSACEAHLQRVRTVMETPAIYYAWGEIYGFAGRYGTGERLALPLSSNGHTPDSLIGATVYHCDDRFRLSESEERMKFSYWTLDGMNQIARDRLGFRRQIDSAGLPHALQ